MRNWKTWLSAAVALSVILYIAFISSLSIFV
jgi:hypothetical protein